MRLRAHITALLLAVAIIGLRGDVRAQKPSAYGVKAAFIFNVANFVEWPASAFASSTAPFRVALVDTRPQPDFAAALQGKSIRGHAVVVDEYQSGEHLDAPHVVFVTSDAATQLRAVLKAAEHQPVLTMAEQDGDAPGAAVVSVGVVQARLAFSVNLDAADAAGLQMNPNLLKLAKSVRSSRAHTR